MYMYNTILISIKTNTSTAKSESYFTCVDILYVAKERIAMDKIN